MTINSKRRITTADLVVCALFAALVAIGAFIRIPIPVIPFTLQTFFVALAGLILGPRLGAISVGVYVALGLVGLPIFTQGGGIWYVFKPTFGYLVGFIIGAYVTGRLSQKIQNDNYKGFLLSAFAGLAVIYVIGIIYFYIICNYVINTPMAFGAVLLYCFVLVIPGDFVLTFVAAGLARRLRPAYRNLSTGTR